MSYALRLPAFFVGAFILAALVLPPSASAFSAVAPNYGVVTGGGAAVEDVTYSYRRNFYNRYPYFLFYRSRPNNNYYYRYYKPAPNYFYYYNYQPRRYYPQYRYY